MVPERDIKTLRFHYWDTLSVMYIALNVRLDNRLDEVKDMVE